MQIMPSHWKSQQSPSKYSTADGPSPTSKESPATSTPKRTPATTTLRRTSAPLPPDKKITLTPNNASATPKEQKKTKKKKDFCAVGKILQNHQNVVLEEILQSLIINLKVPSPLPTSHLSQMEVFFPAHTMGRIGIEMWRHGMMDDSDAFFGSVLHMIQDCAHSYDDGSLAIIPRTFWLSNAQEMFSFVSLVEKGKPLNNCLDWKSRISILRHDLDSLVYNLYQSFTQKIKRHLALMVIPAIIEAQPLPGFITEDESASLIVNFMNLALRTEPPSGRTYTATDIIDLFDTLWRCLDGFFVEPVIVKCVYFELLYLINQVSFNDLIRRTNFCSFKRGLQIQYNIQRIEEWCRSHDMAEELYLLKHIQQATKIGLMKMIYRLVKQYAANNPTIVPPSPNFFQAITVRLQPGDDFQDVIIPIIDEVAPFQAPPPREIDLLISVKGVTSISVMPDAQSRRVANKGRTGDRIAKA
ncbi:hypothetical protein IAS59_006597 [Cryptococcus gattii]